MQTQEILEKLVSINSIYPKERGLVLWLENYLKNTGWKVERCPVDKNRFNLLAEKGVSQKALMFYGHLDTVPTKVTSWRTDPFKLLKKGNKLYGLGAYDMKGGIAAFLTASANTHRRIKLLLAVDEENISEGAWVAVKSKKGFFKNVELIVSAEPNLGLGLNSITIGRTGRSVFVVRFEGVAKHIAEYKSAQDAIQFAGEFINNLYQKRESTFNFPDTVVQVRSITGESVGMSVCGEVKLEVEVLLGTGDSVGDVQKKLKSFHPKAEVLLKSRKTPYLEGYTFKHFPYRRLLADIINKTTGKKMKLTMRSSVGDDNVLATLGIPVITWGPSGGNAHAANEYVEAESLEILTRMYRELFKAV